MNKTWTGLLTAMLAVCGSAAQATTYYVSDCQSGAAAGCVAGNDSNNGLSQTTAWQTASKAASEFRNNLLPGDTILFARGGVWINAGMRLENYNTTAANPLTIDAYTPSSGATAKPILIDTRFEATLLEFSDGGAPEADGGYVVRNLDIRGDGGVSESRGIFANQLTKDIVLEGLNIQDFDTGFYCGFGTPRVHLRNSTVKNSKRFGVLTQCNDSSVENNVFDNNGYGSAVFDHTIYVNSDSGLATNLTFRGNVLTNNSMIDGLCKAVPFVVHGVVNGLLIENNVIRQAANTSGDGCWGIAVDSGYGTAEVFNGVVIRGNTLVNVGGVGIGCSACVSPLIENNVIIQEAGPILTAIAVPDRPLASGDTADTGATIRNNSIWFGAVPTESIGIALAAGGYDAGTNVKVVSNLIYFGTGSQYHACFDTTGMVRGDFAEFNNNLCHHAGGNGRYSPAYATLAAAKAANFDNPGGMDANPQIAATPSSANGWSLALNLGSPAINAGHATQSAPNDRYGVARSGTPDIGAHEYPAAPACTTGPAWVRIANEYRTFTVPASNVVRFGNPNGWITKTTSPSSSCTSGVFPGTAGSGAKWCELQNTWSTATRVAIGQDYQNFTIPTAQTVYYGNASGWTSKSLGAGTYGCAVATFNNVDPAPGTKRCEILVQPATCSP